MQQWVPSCCKNKHVQARENFFFCYSSVKSLFVFYRWEATQSWVIFLLCFILSIVHNSLNKKKAFRGSIRSPSFYPRGGMEGGMFSRCTEPLISSPSNHFLKIIQYVHLCTALTECVFVRACLPRAIGADVVFWPGWWQTEIGKEQRQGRDVITGVAKPS